MRVVVLHPYTKFEVRMPCRSEDMAHDVCVSINGPGNIFDLETGMRVASKVRNPPSKFGYGLWVLELYAMYETDGRTKAMLIAPSLRAGA